MHNAHPHALNNNNPEATFAQRIEANLSERCENKMCPGTLKERKALKQQRTLKVVKFERPIFVLLYLDLCYFDIISVLIASNFDID